MKFSCDRCHKRFSTADEPVDGRVYRIPCKCGNTIVLHRDAAAAPDETPIAAVSLPRPGTPRRAPPPLPAAPAPPDAPEPAISARWVASEAVAIADDPFARAQAHRGLGVLLACASEEVTPTILAAPLARRDPDAVEVSTAYDGDASPFVVELRRTRTHALALGGAAGAAVGGVCAALLTIAVVRPWASAAPPPAADAPAAQIAPVRGPDRPPAARKAPVLRASTTTVAVVTPRPRLAPALPAPAPAPAAPAAPPADGPTARDAAPATEAPDAAASETAASETAAPEVADVRAAARLTPAAALEPERLDAHAVVERAARVDPSSEPVEEPRAETPSAAPSGGDAAAPEPSSAPDEAPAKQP